MKAKRKPYLHGLEEFNLDIEKLTGLGALPVTVYIHFKHLNESKLFSLSPSERKEGIEVWYRKVHARVTRKLSAQKIEVLKTADKKESPHGITIILEAKKLRILMKMPDISSIVIEKIPGYKRRKPAKVEEDEWFAVQARFAIQVEGQTTGIQTYEDRILLVKAVSADKAQKKLRREFKEYGRPYLNSDGYMVRWAFEKILDIYRLFEDEILPEGTEVFSVMKDRRMKPEYQWPPS